MSEHDLQMARGAPPGGFNLAIGEPALLQKYLHFPSVKLAGPYQYPTMDGTHSLVHELRQMHSEGEIVVANGAKQALAASLFALKTEAGRNERTVWHKPPYWPSYDSLIRMAGLRWSTCEDPNPIKCITSPNNPNGDQCTEDYSCDIWDAVRQDDAGII